MLAFLLVALTAVHDGPPREKGTFRPPDLVELTALDDTVHLDIRHAPANNFVKRAVYAAGGRLRPARVRRLPALARDQAVLGRDPARAPARVRGRPETGLQAQPRLRSRPVALRPRHRARGGDARRVRRDVRALVAFVRRRHRGAARGARPPARG